MSFSVLYNEVQQFYANHIQLLDEGKAADVAQTFTEDASMVSPPKVAEPVRGRMNLAAGLGRVAETLAAEGVRYRRCHTMMSVHERSNDEIFVRCYVQVIKTVRGGASMLHAMCVCEDVLVRENGVIKIRERVVTRDDLA